MRVKQVCLYSLALQCSLSMPEPARHKPTSVCQWLCSQHRYCLQFYCTCYQASLSPGLLAGTAVMVLSGRKDLEQLIACSLLALRKTHPAGCLQSCLFCCTWMTSLVLEVVPWSPKGVGGVVWGDRSTKPDNQKWWNCGIKVWRGWTFCFLSYLRVQDWPKNGLAYWIRSWNLAN